MACVGPHKRCLRPHAGPPWRAHVFDTRTYTSRLKLRICVFDLDNCSPVQYIEVWVKAYIVDSIKPQDPSCTCYHDLVQLCYHDLVWLCHAQNFSMFWTYTLMRLYWLDLFSQQCRYLTSRHWQTLPCQSKQLSHTVEIQRINPTELVLLITPHGPIRKVTFCRITRC